MEREEMEQVINAVLDRRSRIDEVTHRQHHEYLARAIDCQDRRRRLVEAIIRQVGGWGVIVILAGIGYAVWHWIGSTLGRNG